jgi:hypothetical protein
LLLDPFAFEPVHLLSQPLSLLLGLEVSLLGIIVLFSGFGQSVFKLNDPRFFSLG